MHPKKLGRYELVSVLGKGAMGVVYDGRDPNLDRRVAIKTVMVDDLAQDAVAEYDARFRTEARSAARLQHPNIVTVYDSDRDGDTAFLVMEFIEGQDLKQHLDRGQHFALPDALRLVMDLLAALDFAHRQGIIHRDVKPANLLIEPGGRLKLTDFGVARITGEATRTQGSMVGTLKYMAPEQVQGLKVDARADLFSAAVVAYQLVTHQRPFDGDNDFSIIHQIIGQDPPLPSTLVPGLPAGVDAVFGRAMAKNRDDRYPTAGEFSSALQEAFGAAGVVAPAHAAVPVSTRPVPATRAPITVPGSGTVPFAQELELEYWRAVRDATDQQELEGFLSRFPQGIYADLARRRLQRLIGETDPDATMLQGVPTLTIPMSEARAQRSPTRTLPITMEPTHAGEAETASTPPPPVEPAAAAMSGAVPGRARKPAARRSADYRLLVPVLALSLLGIGAAWLWNRGAASAPPDMASIAAPPAPVSAAPAAAPALPAQAAAAPTGSVAPNVRPADPGVAIPAIAARSEGGRSGGPVRAARRPDAAPALPQSRPQLQSSSQATPSLAAPSSPDLPRVAPSPRSSPVAGTASVRPVSPAETCKDKFFLVQTLCLRSECARPAFQNHPTCVRLRQEERLHEDRREQRGNL